MMGCGRYFCINKNDPYSHSYLTFKERYSKELKYGIQKKQIDSRSDPLHTKLNPPLETRIVRMRGILLHENAQENGSIGMGGVGKKETRLKFY